MIVVTTPTGHIGSQVVKHLLAAKQKVRVIARDPTKLSAETRAQVEVIQGVNDDEQVLLQALDGADSLFLVVPPSFQDNNDTEYYLRFTRPACRAIKAQRLNRVISVSGLGRDVPGDAGPVTASFAKDTEIENTGVDFRALWCPSFMENMLTQIEPLKHQGAYFWPGRSELKSRHVATQDVASTVAGLLLDRSWSGQGGVAVLGPEDLSWNDIAEIMTEVLGKAIRFQPIPSEIFKAQLMKFGATHIYAQGIVNMLEAKANGLDNAEPRTAENTTPTSFRQWCTEVLEPALRR